MYVLGSGCVSALLWNAVLSVLSCVALILPMKAELFAVLQLFIIYYVMKYRRKLIKYNACISQPWKYKNLYFHSSENARFYIFTGEKP